MNFGPAMTCRAAAVELPALTRLFANIGTMPMEGMQPPPFDAWVRTIAAIPVSYRIWCGSGLLAAMINTVHTWS